jgi:NAD(P)-dependent dehydrogenase (short-subunit alcohol dehydrogenase family)
MMGEIEIDLAGRSYRIVGAPGPIGEAIADALAKNGSRPAAEGTPADLLIAMHPLLLGAKAAALPPLADLLAALADDGRIVVVLSALAGLPARRHVGASAVAAGALAELRALAMASGPRRLINAVGVGLIEDQGRIVAGDPAMAGHAAVGRAGRIADVVGAVLFLSDPANTYTTGQILNVDGGWSTGYGRNF